MNSTHHSFCSFAYRRRRQGFTLVELIVSLAVISVATTILLQLYMASTDLGYLAQNRDIAASIAEGHVSQLVADPGGYVWDHANPDADGLFRIRRNADDPRAGMKTPMPEVLIPDDTSFEHQKAVYDKFRWSAFGRVPSPSSAYVEVTVDVQWTQKGKIEHVALTSVIPRSKVEPDWAEK